MGDRHSSGRTLVSEGVPPDRERVQGAFWRLVETVARLRAPGGCPWDREQTLASIKPYTLEETHEVLEAIDSGVDADIAEELGDLLLQVVLYAQIAADEGRFDLIPVIDGISEKLVRRHPHVFGDVKVSGADEVTENWEQIKKREKKRESLLEGVPVSMPALSRASRISEKAARVGYDWPVREMLFDKLKEELGELADELFEDGKIPEIASGVDSEVVEDAPIADAARLDRAEEELGDLLFVIANIGRRWGINPEEALRRTNRKFERRFAAIERAAAEAGKRIDDLSLQEMEAFYQVARREAKAAKSRGE